MPAPCAGSTASTASPCSAWGGSRASVSGGERGRRRVRQRLDHGETRRHQQTADEKRPRGRARPWTRSSGNPTLSSQPWESARRRRLPDARAGSTSDPARQSITSWHTDRPLSSAGAHPHCREERRPRRIAPAVPQRVAVEERPRPRRSFDAPVASEPVPDAGKCRSTCAFLQLRRGGRRTHCGEHPDRVVAATTAATRDRQRCPCGGAGKPHRGLSRLPSFVCGRPPQARVQRWLLPFEQE